MNIVEKLIASLVERIFGHYVTTIIGALVIVSATLGGAASAISANLMLYGVNVHAGLVTAAAVVLGVACVLAKDSHVKLPTQVGIALAAAILLLLPVSVRAQASASSAPPTGLRNIYAGGLSYSVSASPGIAGSALYAHQVNNSGTYAFTAIDATPETLKPFLVTSNVGAGIAQRVATLGKLSIYMPTAAGISWSGSNTGWQWSGGATTTIPLKNGYFLMPTVRFLKSSVSGGSGYQPIVGLLIGWGQ